MALFGLFKRNVIAKHGPRAGDKRAQAPDRWESIVALCEAASAKPSDPASDQRAAAIEALLVRFTFSVDPSITDGQEKDEAFRGICRAGDIAIEPVRKAIRKHESPSWTLKIFEQLLSEPKVVDEMLAVLETMDTEYERDPQRKIQILSALEEKRHAGIVAAVTRFFADVNETCRFHAVGAALAQEDAGVIGAIVQALGEEDSVRVKNRALETFAQRAWSLGEGKDKVALPPGWALDKSGIPKRAAKK